MAGEISLGFVGLTKASTIFGGRGEKKDIGNMTGPFRQFGYAPDGDPVDDAYLITISSRVLGVDVVGIMQDNIKIDVDNSWDKFGGIGTNDLLEGLAQYLMDVSWQMPWKTRRIWKGSSPLSLTVQLRFDATRDALVEVVQPCLILQQMSLPGTTTLGEVFDLTPEYKGLRDSRILIPPGPSPFKGVGKEGDTISVNYGKFFVFDSVILKSVSLDFDSKMDVNGNPVAATASVVFETFEMYTKEKMLEAYKTLAPKEQQPAATSPYDNVPTGYTETGTDSQGYAIVG